MDWLNYHHLYYFYVVAKEGSIGRACEILHVSQPTISSQLRELGQALKAPLFRKHGRGLQLTDTGHAVLPYAEGIFALGQELKDAVNGRPVGRPARLRVGVVDVIPKLLVHNILRPALVGPSPVRLACSEGKLADLAAELVVHTLDLVVSDSPLPSNVRAKVFTHLLGESGVSVYGTADLARQYRDGFPTSLDGAPFLVPAEGTTLRRSLDQWFDAHNLRPDIRGEFEDSALLKMFGRSGHGLFALPSAADRDLREHYSVQPVGLAQGLKERYYAISVERRIRHPAVAAICEEAKAVLADTAKGEPR
jgi:LysR family transcriptional regulator, transcriptional activator of nhaA